MLRNNLKSAWRSLLHQRQYTVTNIAGLAVAMCCCIFIYLYVRDERSYDRYHEGANRIYRVARVDTNSDGQSEAESRTVKAVAFTLRRDLPEVEAAATILQLRQWVMRYNDKQFYETRVFEADSNFFDVFTIEFVRGTSRNVLRTLQSIVLTESMAVKYFGDEDAIGKTINCEGKDYFVDAIVKDVPLNSHFHFDFLVALRTIEKSHDTEWQGMQGYHTYLKLREHTDPGSFESNLGTLAKNYTPQSTSQYFIQPLTDIHLTSKLKGELEQNGDSNTIKVMIGIALIVIAVACINYLNLATARSVRRAKEVGVRKTSGAGRWNLIVQFLTESVLTAMLSFCLSMMLVIAFHSVFNRITGKALDPFSLDLTSTWLSLAALAFGVGLLAGFYPAMYLSSMKPVKVLKSGLVAGLAVSSLRKSLAVLQFVISICLLVGTITIMRQMDFITSKDPGFDKDLVIVINNVGRIPGREAIEHKIEQLSGVREVGASTSMPGKSTWSGNIRAVFSQSNRLINFCQIDYEYLDAMGIRILEGRNFSSSFPTDTINTIILNETAVSELGLTNPIGQRMAWDATGLDTVTYSTVVGVVNDFHFSSFHEPIKPFAFLVRDNFFVPEDFTSRLFVKTVGVNQMETVHQLEVLWKEFVPDRPFTYVFMDDSFRELHKDEQHFKSSFTLLTGLSLFIAGMGLFALVAFVSEQRTKEIGIRKVFGASMINIVVMINKEFVVLIAVALMIASPIAYYFSNLWLQDFAYHTELTWWIFAISGLATLVIALLSTGYQSIKASMANPVDSIRTE